MAFTDYELAMHYAHVSDHPNHDQMQMQYAQLLVDNNRPLSSVRSVFLMQAPLEQSVIVNGYRVVISRLHDLFVLDVTTIIMTKRPR
jgi:hypothetical protein